LTIYCGRNERLIQPILDRFTQRSGIPIRVRYGSTSELAATLMEEDRGTPAALFIAQDAAALGALSRAGLFRPLPSELLQDVPPQFRSAGGDWVGLSGRARVIVYNVTRVEPTDLPQSLTDATDPRFKGRFGIAPSNASFQAQLAAFRSINGPERFAELLDGLVRNEPHRYAKNSPIVQAVIAGEIDWGLVNHYYLWRALQEDPDAPARNFFMPADDGSSFVNLAGAGMLREDPRSVELLHFLLSDEAQRYFAEQTFEYPLAAGVEPAVALPPLGEVTTSNMDYGRLAENLDTVLRQISDSGLLQF
jgi:iron(III) transport system substrate-binding protein